MRLRLRFRFLATTLLRFGTSSLPLPWAGIKVDEHALVRGALHDYYLHDWHDHEGAFEAGADLRTLAMHLSNATRISLIAC